jgi:hypothetical protein
VRWVGPPNEYNAPGSDNHHVHCGLGVAVLHGLDLASSCRTGES